MSIELAGYNFSGPYTTTSSLEHKSGVYAVLATTGIGRYRLIDVGESHDVRYRVENHDRTDCWRRQSNNGRLEYAVYYTPWGREAIERKVREEHDPPCGKQ